MINSYRADQREMDVYMHSRFWESFRVLSGGVSVRRWNSAEE